MRWPLNVTAEKRNSRTGSTATTSRQSQGGAGGAAVKAAPAAPPPPAGALVRTLTPDPVLLFRYSALTGNGHRIHYDLDYVTREEGYPGLVVHGPLQAVLLFDAACRHEPGRTPTRFDFRGVRPLFDFETATVNGRTRDDGATEVFTATADGAVCMQAIMQWV